MRINRRYKWDIDLFRYAIELQRESLTNFLKGGMISWLGENLFAAKTYQLAWEFFRGDVCWEPVAVLKGLRSRELETLQA
jgi:hypothetical protein